MGCKHVFVEDADNYDAARSPAVEQHMLFALKPPRSFGNVIACATNQWSVREQYTASVQRSEVFSSLITGPGFDGVNADLAQVGSCARGKLK